MTDSKTFGRSRPSLTAMDGDPYVTVRDLPTFGISYHRAYLGRKIRKGSFPKPTHLGKRRLAWRRSELLKWLDDQRVEA